VCLGIGIFPTSLMKMILSSLNLVRKIGVCITSEENEESQLTSEENLFNNLLSTLTIYYLIINIKKINTVMCIN
jgi:hypothetical protein